MKRFFKKILQFKLKILTKFILAKYKPQLVGITGSVGKSSTTEAINLVLSAAFRVRKSYKNYNNEIGIPLTIIGIESGGNSFFAWCQVFFKAFRLIIFKDKDYPEILILEIGVDRPGDIYYLTNFLSIKIGVVTAIAPVHIEFFGTLEKIAEEKMSLVKVLSKEKIAVLNNDDASILAVKSNLKCQILTFGLLPGADFYASDISLITNNFADPYVTFKLNYQGNAFRVNLLKIIAEHLIYSVLPAIAIGIVYKIELPAIIKVLENFEAPPGRMKMIDGIKNTTIIDDTYNSSPLAVKKALYQLSKIEPKNNGSKFAVLGDMLELGSVSVQAHQETGQAVKEFGIDYLVTAGELSRDIIRGAIDAGFNADYCFNFFDSEQAGQFIQQKIKEGDIILVKGSQGMRMEKIVKEIMAEPQKAQQLLVRQDKSWQ